MNRIVSLLCILTLAGGVFCSKADSTNAFFDITDQAVPDANLTGLANSQTLDFSGNPLFTSISSIQVTLNISGGFNGDLFGYLYHNGNYAVLLNRTGRDTGTPAGQSGAGIHVTLSDSGTDIHTASGSGVINESFVGQWAPDGRTTFPALTLQGDTRSATPLTSAFAGTDANGTWTLFLADVDFGETATLESWGLIITAVPEPSTMALLSLAGFVASGLALARRRK